MHATISAAVQKIRGGEGPQFIEATNGSLSRQRNQLAHRAAADPHFARLGCQQRAGKAREVVSFLRPVADFHS